MAEKKEERLGWKPVVIVGGIILAAVIVAFVMFDMKKEQKEPVIITTSKLEKIINVSDLSTYQATYNGIAKVKNKKTEKIDYYVTYNSKVNVGIDFEKVDIFVDNEKKSIEIELPAMEILDVVVDIDSMDYIFKNEDANKSGVSKEAYEKCIEDAEKESAKEEEIINLASDNAKNVMKALVEPFVEQLDDEYTLEIR